jgi:hypothetical protein
MIIPEDMNQPKPRRQKNKLDKQRGQVAIFVALIFQVLFVFFAMLVNVGLLVHHKINLQNSVDLAAYYGAMKQAEMLNVIAHSNYQIRQSWKLLVFRYRHLGTYGDDTYPGARSQSSNASNTSSGLFPSFCITYHPFDIMNSTENYCRQSGQNKNFTIHTPPVPTHVSTNFLGLQSWDQLNIDITNTIRGQIQASCVSKQAFSYYELENFVYAYKRDIANRKRLIIQIGNDLSAGTGDFNDLDGNSVLSGVESTLMKNLTYQNLGNAQPINGVHVVQFYNSLGGTSGGDLTPPKWLSEIRIFPIFWAYIGDCSTDALNYYPYPINVGADPPGAITSDTTVGGFIKQVNPSVQEPGPGSTAKQLLYASSLGYEKNPWYVPYVGVHAETKPQIPFSPFGAVTLKATAYAKPFGGTIGPWWGKQWLSAGTRSDDGSPNDNFVQPPRMLNADSLPTSANETDPRYTADFPRYVGDKVGTQSNLSMYQISRVLNSIQNGKLSMTFWTHLISPSDDLEQIGSNGDMLAWGNISTDDPTSVQIMRNLELQMIAPNQYDVAYYSIEPDFYRNYYLRLKKRESTFGFPVRSDLGQRALDPTLVNFSVKEQIAAAQKFSNSGSGMDLANALSFYAKTPAELLTGYKSTAPDDTTMDVTNNFGKCAVSLQDSDPQVMATVGNCIAGGRVGYSVKLVDGDFLAKSSNLPLGGSNTSGPMMNPPPGF